VGAVAHLKNSTGATIVKGTVVKMSAAADDSIIATTAGGVGAVGVVVAVSSSEGDGPTGSRATYELCVRWDGALDESWCGEADVQTTGYKRELRRAGR
jgi:hypothetical protein